MTDEAFFDRRPGPATLALVDQIVAAKDVRALLAEGSGAREALGKLPWDDVANVMRELADLVDEGADDDELAEFVARIEMERDAQRCRRCGCTAWAACEGGCSWVEVDLCSECEASAVKAGARPGGAMAGLLAFLAQFDGEAGLALLRRPLAGVDLADRAGVPLVAGVEGLRVVADDGDHEAARRQLLHQMEATLILVDRGLLR